MQEKRRYTRRPVDYALEIEGPAGALTPGVCRDLSMGGMHVETAAAPPFGTQIFVHVDLKGAGRARLPATIRWVKPGAVGLQFGLLGARETYAISQIVAENTAP